MRIGLIAPPWIPVPPPQYGGTETVVDALARGFVAAGHEVLLCATGDSTCPVPRTSYWGTSAPLGFAPVEIRHVLHAYEAVRDCDVVHDHTVAGPLLLSRHPAGVPTVTTTHGALTPDTVPLYQAMADGGVAIVAISRSQRDSAPTLPVARVIHHGVPVDDIAVGNGDSGFVLFLGRMNADKGVHRAIDAARRAGVPLVIAAKMREAGERAYFDSVVRPRLGPDAEYVGEVDAGERWRLLRDARALVNPISWPEPFGLVMIEALACGTPVVTTACGAAPEIVDDGKTGFVCATDDSLAEALGRVGEIDRAWCRAVAESRFSATRMVDEHLELYAALRGD